MGVLHPVRLSLFGNRRLIPLNVACGYGFTMFICKDSSDNRLSVYGCGVNSDGQLGQLNTLKGILADTPPSTDTLENDELTVHIVPTPVRISLPVSAEELKLLQPTHVACGRTHSLIALQSPVSSSSFPSDQPPLLFSLGNNTFGQCGRQVVEGEIFKPESAMVTRVGLPKSIRRIKQLCCGQDHTLLLTEDGVVYSCGLGSDGQTGLATLSSVDQFTRVAGAIEGVPIVELASRGDTVLALAESGQLFAWGNNEYGQIWPASDCLQVSRPVELPLHRYLVPPEARNSLASTSALCIQRIRSIACAGSNCCIVDEAGHTGNLKVVGHLIIGCETVTQRCLHDEASSCKLWCFPDKNPYDILGVARSATTRKIRSAYYEKSMRLHPDRVYCQPGTADAERFCELSAAYELLVNPQSRQAYDRTRCGLPTQMSCGDDKVDVDFYKAMKVFQMRRHTSRRPHQTCSSIPDSSRHPPLSFKPSKSGLWLSPSRSFSRSHQYVFTVTSVMLLIAVYVFVPRDE